MRRRVAPIAAAAFFAVVLTGLLSASGTIATPSSAAPAASASPSPDPAREFRERLQLMELLRSQSFQLLRPSQLDDPPKDELEKLRASFGPLAVFDPGRGGEATRYDSSGIVREAYESAGKLYFVLDRSPVMGNHFLTLYAFAHALTPVRLSFPTQDLQGLDFTDMTRNVAILQGFEKRDASLEHYWKLRDGAFTPITKSEAVAPRSRSPRPLNPATCSFNDGGVTFVGGNGTMEISPIVLSSATHNIANAHGITMGCRRVGTTNLLWLFSDEDAQNGVTFVVEPGRLRPLFVGHPFIQTAHYLVFVHVDDPEGNRIYLLVRSD